MGRLDVRLEVAVALGRFAQHRHHRLVAIKGDLVHHGGRGS